MSSKNEVKINKISQEIRSELSLALNNWQDLDSRSKSQVKAEDIKEKQATPARKTKLLKTIQAQLKNL